MQRIPSPSAAHLVSLLTGVSQIDLCRPPPRSCLPRRFPAQSSWRVFADRRLQLSSTPTPSPISLKSLTKKGLLMSSAPVVAAMTRAFLSATRPLASTNAALAAQQIANVVAATGADDNRGLALLLAIASRRGRCIYKQNKRISSLMEQKIAF
ncbi:hypothetical protein DAI22_03g183450 [Oryza sativa Japonica Group]|nr:hypothetical protein DAI22_03g183450 [Oryza sativa Japonica Group]